VGFLTHCAIAGTPVSPVDGAGNTRACPLPPRRWGSALFLEHEVTEGFLPFPTPRSAMTSGTTMP